MTPLRIVVVDDDSKRREKIKSILPEYAEVFTPVDGKKALDYIKQDAAGTVPDLVIVNGDDSKGQGLYIFDWMVNKSANPLIEGIPVLVLCEDEFSDRSLDFLEIGDVTFCQGEIDEDDFFSLVFDTIDGRVFAEEPVIPSYEETKNIDRLIGQSIKVTPSVPGKERKIVIGNEAQLENLEAALERGRRRVEEIRTVLNAASEGSLDERYLAYRKHKKKNKTDILRKKAISNPEAAMKAQQTGPGQNGAWSGSSVQTGSSAQTGNRTWPGNGAWSGGSAQTKHSAGTAASGNVYPGRGYGAGQYAGNPYVGNQYAVNRPYAKRRIIVVDDDPQVRKLCELYLSTNYEVITFDSGMKAIDFFIRNTADLLMVDAVLPGMGGKQTVGSIRYQAGGTGVPVLFLVGDDYQGPREMLLGDRILGILKKPLTQGALAMAVDGYFREL